jgi:hypothetical protein
MVPIASAPARSRFPPRRGAGEIWPVPDSRAALRTRHAREGRHPTRAALWLLGCMPPWSRSHDSGEVFPIEVDGVLCITLMTFAHDDEEGGGRYYSVDGFDLSDGLRAAIGSGE